MNNIETVSVNKFVFRQIKGSGKTYANDISFNDIALHAKNQLQKKIFKNGYRDGVILVPVSKKLIHHFICPFIKVEEDTKLIAKYIKRRPEEEPYIQIQAESGTPLTTGSVNLILYHHNILVETNEQSSNADWELISFHAIPKGQLDMPMGPVTMMRNQLQLKGGTKGHYKSIEWAKSVKYWQNYVSLAPSKTTK